MKLVNQRTDCDCSVACLAMYAEKTYEEIIAATKELGVKVPMGADGMCKILRHFEFKPIVLRQWVWQTKGILAVPSLNFPGLNHVICWTGDCKNGEALDPQSGRDGKIAYTTERMLNGKTGWVDFITDAADETVRMFAELEIKQLREDLDQ